MFRSKDLFFTITMLIISIALVGCVQTREQLPNNVSAVYTQEHSADMAPNTYVLTGGPAFEGSVPQAAALERVNLETFLLQAGFPSDSPRKNLVTNPVMKPYYFLNLAFLQPMYDTEDGEIICYLKDDSARSIIFVLDKMIPDAVSYYLKDGWDVQTSIGSVLLDGNAPSARDMDSLDSIIDAHFSSNQYMEFGGILDGTGSLHTITIELSNAPGLTYIIPYFQYTGGMITVYNLTDETVVKLN